MRKILLLAGLIYLLVGAVTYHPDTKLTLYYPSVADGKIWNIYRYLDENKENVPAFHYPPVNYWLLKAELPIAQVVGGDGLERWLAMDSTNAVSDNKIFQYNLAVKLPLYILLLISGWLVYRLVERTYKSGKAAAWAMTFWLLNPITLYSTVIMGQNDILAMMPFLVGLLFYFTNPLLAFGLFGIAASVKSFPLIWTLFLGLAYPTTSLVKKYLYSAIGVVIYGLTLTPFIGSPYFRDNVINSGLAARIFEPAIAIGFGEKLLIIPTLLMLVLVLIISRKRVVDFKYLNLILITINMVMLGWSHYHPQWMVWVMPFLAMFLVSEGKIIGNWLMVAMIFMIGFIGTVLLFDDKFLYWGLVSPLNPGLLNLPFISEVLGKLNVEAEMWRNMMHSIMAGTSIYFIYKLATEKIGKIGLVEFPDLKRWQMKRGESIVLAVGGTVLVMGLIFWVVGLVPSVKKEVDSSQSRLEFRKLTELKNSFKVVRARYDNFYRVEVLMKNPALSSQDEFEIRVTDDMKKVVVAKQFSGFNVGDPSYARVDFPVVTGGRGRFLTIEVRPVKIVDGNLAVGVKDEIVVSQEFYRSGFSMSEARQSLVDNFEKIIRFQPLVLVVIILGVIAWAW